MSTWSIDIDAWADGAIRDTEAFVVAGLLDILAELVLLGQDRDGVKGIVDTGNWKGSWYAVRGDSEDAPTDAGIGRDSMSQIVFEIAGYQLGDTWSFINGASYSEPVEFADRSPHKGKVRDVLARAPAIIGQTARRFAT